ncbi:MAG: SMC-Scp complex subunit ScpB, partial [bacterium]
MLNQELGQQILAILFAAREPVELTQLIEVFGDLPALELQQAAETVMAEFNSSQTAVELRKVGGGFRITTRPEHHEMIRR